MKFYDRRLYEDVAPVVELTLPERPPITVFDQVICADSRSLPLPDSSVHLIITSPPYAVGMAYDTDQSILEYLEMLEAVYRECWRVLERGGRICVNTANVGRKPYRPFTAYTHQILQDIGFLARAEIIWSKSQAQKNNTAWGSFGSAKNPTIRDQHEYCNPPDAPIWMADYSFRSLGDIKVGDKVIGWEARPTATGKMRRHLCNSEVLAISVRKAPLCRVVFWTGEEIRCTPDHYWAQLNGRPNSGTPRVGLTGYSEYIQAAQGVKMGKIIVPTPSLATAEQKWAATYLSGIYDGEGHGTGIAQSADHNPEVRVRIEQCLRILNLPVSKDKMNVFCRRPGNKNGRKREEGRQTHVNFLNWIDPVRKVTKENDRCIKNAMNAWPEIVDQVIPDGYGDVVSMQTTTGNYIAWGFGSKNCLIYCKEQYSRMYKGKTDITNKEFVNNTLSIWNILPASAKRIGHPAPFPLELPKRLIKTYSYVGDVVLDPFGGSGTTGLAALQTGRHYVVVDNDPEYCALAEKRIWPL